MLEISKNYYSAPPELGFAGEQSGTPAEYVSIAIGILSRQWPLVVITLAFTVVATTTYYLEATPMYKAVATVALDARKFQLFQQPASLGEVSIDSSAAVESQVEILKSEKITLQVINDLHIAEAIAQTPSPGLLGSLFGPTKPLSDFERTRAALAIMQKRLTIKRLGIAWVIDISFESPDPDRAAQIANAMADAYVADQLAAKYDATRQGSVWLEGRIKELHEQSLAAQRAVVEFKAKYNIVDAGGGRLMGEQQLTELNGELGAARVQTSELKSRLERISAISQAASEDATLNASLTGVLSNETLTKLRTQYSELSSRETEFAAKYGREHNSVVNLRNQMAQIRAAMVGEVRRLAESYRSDYDLALKREKNLASELAKLISQSATTNRAQVTLRELESAAQTSTSMYENFVKRYMESVEQQSLPISEARVITRASPSSNREYKTLLRALTAIFGGGISVGLGIAVLRELGDRTYRTVAQIERRLHINCIALVPLVKIGSDQQTERRPVRQKTDATALASRTLEEGQNPIWSVVGCPLSGYAEAMRSIKLAVDHKAIASTNKVIGLTSSLPGEGKSTVAASLALSIGRAGARVILIDFDLRNPALTRTLAPGATAGFLEVLAGKISFVDALWMDESKIVSFLPAVLTSHFVESHEIMASKITKRLFDWLRNEYDYIVVDLPPLAPVVDTRASIHLIDSHIFVVEWGRTRTDVVEHALGRASDVVENVLGVVLNKVDMNRLNSYDNKNASYYKNKLYSQYGYFD